MAGCKMTKQTKCRRCGTCCRQGGPALHEEDRQLLAGKLKISDLITIRKDELVYSPLSGQVEKAEMEFLKIGGQGKSWVCKFFNPAQSSCTIHAWRPLECRELKCWDTEDIKKIIYKDVINRFDLLEPNEKIIPLLREHEAKCSWHQVNKILRLRQTSTNHNKLDELIRIDLAIRARAIELFSLTVDQELFYLGRPIFQIVEAM
jgi:Fe-S-cluster containining protein